MPQFGDSQKLRLVRILRSTVMVRVGGGWVALDEFLVKNDPCRGKRLPLIQGLSLEDCHVHFGLCLRIHFHSNLYLTYLMTYT